MVKLYHDPIIFPRFLVSQPWGGPSGCLGQHGVIPRSWSTAAGDATVFAESGHGSNGSKRAPLGRMAIFLGKTASFFYSGNGMVKWWCFTSKIMETLRIWWDNDGIRTTKEAPKMMITLWCHQSWPEISLAGEGLRCGNMMEYNGQLLGIPRSLGHFLEEPYF
jgi:hypothetical protein